MVNQIMNKDAEMSILVLSCDEYSDLWDDFFSFKDRYWPDCPYPTYLVNDVLPYERDGVTVLNAGCNARWSTRVRKALERIDTPYVCPILDDHFIIRHVDSNHIGNLVNFVKTEKVSYLAFEGRSFLQPKDEWKRYKSDFVIIPKHQKYGINTSAAIWNKEDYLKLIGMEEYSPWQFEINMCELSKTEEGLPGLILFDPYNSLNICEKEVVRQGVFIPNSVAYVKKVTGVDINTSGRGKMSLSSYIKEMIIYKASRAKYGKNIMKKIAQLLGFKFLS